MKAEQIFYYLFENALSALIASACVKRPFQQHFWPLEPIYQFAISLNELTLFWVENYVYFDPSTHQRATSIPDNFYLFMFFGRRYVGFLSLFPLRDLFLTLFLFLGES